MPNFKCVVLFKPHIYTAIILTTLFSVFSFSPGQIQAEELDIVNRPINSSGLTGLLVTTSPFTLEAGRFEAGIAINDENSKRPDYTLTEYRALIAAGIGQSMELALTAPYVHKRLPDSSSETGVGDMNISWKWNFLKSNPESPIRPAAAVFITGVLPTGDRGLNQVVNWGGRLGISAGTEISWLDHVLGIHADAQVAVQDLSNDEYRDRFQIMNAGIIFPISKYRNLQLLIEYSLVSGTNVVTVEGGDYSAFTYGLRLVSERLNLTIGTQFLHKQLENYDSSSRVIGMLSGKF